MPRPRRRSPANLAWPRFRWTRKSGPAAGRRAAETRTRTPPAAFAASSSARPAAASPSRPALPACGPTRPPPDAASGSPIRPFVDFVNGQTQPYDEFGHGTHVAGILAGSGAASSQLEDPYLGMAPEVDLVVLKVLDGNGAG